MDKDAKGAGDEDLLREMHKAIRDVTLGVESFGFNAAIAKLYGFTATLSKSKASHSAQKQAIMTLAQLNGPHDAAPRGRYLGASGRRRVDY